MFVALVWSLCVGSAIAAYQGFDIFVPHSTGTTSYVSRLVAAMPWTAFTAMCKLVGGHMLSIKTWASQRDRGTSTVARDFSMSTKALTTDFNDLQERWTKRGVLGWAARQTVFLLVHSGAILYDFTPGPLVDTFGGAIVDFLFACIVSAVVLHVQGEIALKRRKTYAAACFHGCAIILTVTLGFVYFDDAHQVVVNALAVAVVRAVMHGHLIEFKITVICCFVEMKRVSTWTYNVEEHLQRFQAVAGVIVPESQLDDGDGSEGIDVGSGGGVDIGGDNAYRRIRFSIGDHSPLGRLATQGHVGKDKALEIDWDSDQAQADVAHAISKKDELPWWLKPHNFSRDGLHDTLDAIYNACEARSALLLQESPQTGLAVRAGGRLRLAFRLREPRLNVKLAPLLIVDDVPNDVPWIGTSDAAKFLAHYCCMRETSMFLLLALVNAMREDYDSELPPCISNGCWELDRFTFSERPVEDLPDFVRRLRAFIDTEWPTVSKSNGVRAGLLGSHSDLMYAQVARPHRRRPLRDGPVPKECC